MKTKVIVYTQQGCPHCSEMKQQLKEENIVFETRDIEEHNKPYIA